MDESKEEMSSGRKVLNPFAVRKPKKRSLVERELETNMTARVTSPAMVEEGVSTSRYGRARRSKSGNDSRNILDTLKSPKSENTPVRVQSPITKEVSSTFKVETPKKALEPSLDNIDNTYQANKSLNRYKSEVALPKSPPSAKKFPKVYIRTDLIQNRDNDDDIILIKDLFSPKSAQKMGRDSSSKKHNTSYSKQNGHVEIASVVKALDFDGNSRDSNNRENKSGNKRDYSGNKRDTSGNKRESNDNTIIENDSISEFKPELFKGEATCPYQVGDLAWARMGTFPFWPCIITRDPESQMFVRKKLFGRVEHDILHVTFFADNGRRSWVVDNMLRPYVGLEEFLSTREKFTAEDKKKDPRLYSAFFISEKKQSLWNTSVEEAELINREPKNLRIDIFNDLLYKTRASKKQQKSGKVTRTDSDVSLSESLYDSLFSEDDSKVDDSTRSRNKSRNKSLDVSDVVTACLDNMAAKTGNIKIQRQSHMDRWLQKAKSKTPEKVKNKIDQTASKTPVITPKVETVTLIKVDKMDVPNVEKVVPKVEKTFSNNKKKKLPPKEVKITKVYSLRRSYESQNALIAQTEVKTDLKEETHVSKLVKNNSETIDLIDCSNNEPNTVVNKEKTEDHSSIDNSNLKEPTLKANTDIGSKAKLELLKDDNNICKEDENDDVLNAINELLEDSSTADSTDIIPRTSDVIVEFSKEKREETLSKDLNLDIKPEIMDVDDIQENNSLEKPAATTEVIPDSSIKTENDPSINNNLVNGSPVEIDCNIVATDKLTIDNISTVVLDQKTNQDGIKITTSGSEPSTNTDLESKQDEMVSKSNDLNQTSPSLKNNEMVSIPDNCNMTDDESNSMTSIEYNAPVEIDCNIVATDKLTIDNISTVVLDQKTNQDGIKITTSGSEPSTNTDLESKQDEMVSKSNDLNQTSPSLKNNEMVSIPDNCNMTDDESNSMTSIEYNAHLKDLQDHNSNLTNVSTKSKSDIVEMTKKVNDSTSENDSTKKDIAIDECDMSFEKPDIQTEKLVIPIENNDTSITETEVEDISMNEKHLLNESGQSASILQIDEVLNVFEDSEPKSIENSTGISVNSADKLKSVLVTCKNSTQEINTIEMKIDENRDTSSNIESNPFLGVSSIIDVYKDTATKDTFFREVNMNKPPDLTIESIAAKADLIVNGQNCESENEESEDEPSPEYEPLGEEITEDFRQHMKCIESSITDKKDEAQLVKVCNEIAIIEESKFKLADIKISMNKISPDTRIEESRLNSSLEKTQNILKDERIKTEKVDEAKSSQLKIEKVLYEETIDIDLTKTPDFLTKDSKAEIQDGMYIINKAAENKLKSPLDKKKHKLSLKKDKSSFDDNMKNDNINPRYKTIDQIEQIMKNKPKRLPIENGEVNIPEIKENGYHLKENTPEQFDDDDFDIDDASVNSEDSEVSLPHEKVPARRSLRSKPVKKIGLEDPEFLTYMELRQDDLMEQHPELSMDDIVLYLFKTFMYTQNLKSDVEVEEPLVITNNIKQETPPSRKKSKKTIQPKNTIENFFREKYKKAKKIDFDSEGAGVSDSNDYIKPKRDNSISPVDSGIGNSKDSNESETPVQRKNKSKSPQTDHEVTKDVKVELINDVIEQEIVSPKTPKRLRKKTYSPKVLETGKSKTSPKVRENSSDKKRWPVVVISPIKDKLAKLKNYLTKDKRDIRTNLRHDFETTHEPSIEAKVEPTLEVNHEPIIETNLELKRGTKCEVDTEMIPTKTETTKNEPVIETKQEQDIETESLDSDSELPLRQLRSKVIKENVLNELKREILELKDEIEDTESVSSDNVPLLALKPKKVDKSIEGSYEDPEFLKYLEIKQDNIMDENPQLSQNEIKAYLYKTWIYEKDSKSDIQKIDDIESQNLVKGLNNETVPTRKKRKMKTEKHTEPEEVIPKFKPRRKTVSHYYNEAFISDIEDELEVFEIFKTKNKPITVVSKPDSPKKEAVSNETKTEEPEENEDSDSCEEINTKDEIELYFKQLPSSKPSVFKGLIREKVCEICEDISNLIKCKGCNGSFHYDCVKKEVKIAETPATFKGRKKKKKLGRKPKNHDDSDHSDEQNVSEENISIEEIPESITIDAETLESQLEAKMKELMDKETQLDYDSYSSDDCIDWTNTIPGKCELIDVKLKPRTPPIDVTNFKCNNCQKYDTPVCFVCKSAVSKTDVKIRQKCNVAHCYCYYHLECLDHWPQTQFNAGEWTKSTKKSNEQFEALTCPRHVCHTCVSDDPRGCKTRFSGDKLARCVRCPATYHSFNKCLPAGTQILTASFIICPRHYEHRPGKVPCHVNTGWCFICALGGSLICCEYCPTSFHAECLNIKPPEGNYMCEDCETGRLPLYGEMVWVKLGHYRWWPGVVLHPSEIPDNIMAVKHGLGEFVVRFFGQYDHYWVNRGRVFPYQEGDSGRISSQKSKIDVAFTTAMEHAQRAFEILKNAEPDEEESLDIASSLLPPHYVKLKCNKPIGSLLGRKMEDPSLSLTQCECSPEDGEPCGPNSQCINRMLLTECGPTCRAGDRCSNRAFEKRLYPKLTPYRAPHRGWGLKTLEDIKAGQFVIEYVGELIDEEEFQRRMRRKHEIRDENFYFLTLDKERMIDAGPKGNLARFMNHCCEPNCETQKWTVLGDIRVGLFAIDDIKANSEVTFNYNFECTGIEKKRCLCGAKRCSGYIGAKLKQSDETQRKKNGTLIAKRKYTKRKNIEESPSTSKNKVKKPVGRPPKPKELTEIEKDLFIIKSATSPEPSQSTEESHNPKRKTDSITMEEGLMSSEQKTLKKKSDSNEEATNSLKIKLDCNTMNEVSISNGMEFSKECKTLKRKLDLNTIEEVTISNAEPSAKRIKCDKQIEVGD